jgi:long-chain acyl-CoA synthetase
MSVLNTLLSGPPRGGHQVRVAALGRLEAWDHPQIWELSGRVAAHLRRLGVGPGDRVGIRAANCLEWVLLDLAALRLGAVTAGYDPGKFPQTGSELVAAHDLTVLFTDRAETGDRVRSLRGLRDLPPSNARLPAVTWAPEAATALKFTSGSSGPAKSLLASAGSIDDSLTAVQAMFGHGPGDDLFVFLPLSLLQQRYWIYSALVFGHDVTITTYESAFVTMASVRPTVVMGVPGFYEAARSHIEATARRTGTDPATVAKTVFGDRIRYLWTGSAPARAATLEFFGDAGLPIYEGYGLNETCIVAKNHPGAHRVGSVGRMLDGREVIIDSDGVINVRARHPVATRYEHAGPGESEAMFKPGGIVRTGDLGRLDADGFLYVLGRADDTIVLDNGKKIVVRPIEERLRASPFIEDCVLVNPSPGELVAIVSPTADDTDPEGLRAALRDANSALSHDEQLTKLVVSERFTVANGLLSVQLKPRRQQIEAACWSLVTDPKEGIHA